jgi:ribosomal protein S25
MATLTRKQRAEIDRIRDQLTRALTFLDQPDVAVVRRRQGPDKGVVQTEIDKRIGSELALARTALRALDNFAVMHSWT